MNERMLSLKTIRLFVSQNNENKDKERKTSLDSNEKTLLLFSRNHFSLLTQTIFIRPCYLPFLSSFLVFQFTARDIVSANYREQV